MDPRLLLVAGDSGSHAADAISTAASPNSNS